MENRIEIELGNGYKLVAERNTGTLDRELLIGIVHEDYWIQDLALISPTYTWDLGSDNPIWNPIWDENKFDIMVWEDPHRGEHTIHTVVDLIGRKEN